MEPDAQLLDELVRRIVETVHPLRIILFGSAARGEMGRDSDLDVLVVMPDGIPRWETAQLIRRYLMGLGFAKDILVVTESDIERHRCYSLPNRGVAINHAARRSALIPMPTGWWC